MPDRETLINDMMLCFGDGVDNPDPCNYCSYSAKGACVREMTRDALALLREQEPVVPTETGDGDALCGNCGETVGSEELNCGGISMVKYKYCPNCGRKVKWDE